MSDQQVKVVFQPFGRAVFVTPGVKMVEAAARAGLTIETPCGGQGICGKCRVQVITGAAGPTESESLIYTPKQIADGWRLGCQTTVAGAAVVNLPDTSLFASQHQILMEAQKGKAADVQPAVRKAYVELPEPTLADGDADMLRMERKIGPFKAGLGLLRRLPKLLREGRFKGTAVLTDHHLIDFEPGQDTSKQCYGVAFDIGTTTLVGSLLDLCTGSELAITSRINPQVSFGDDVLSRINYTGQRADGLEELHRAVIDAVADMITILCAEAGVGRQNIYEASFAGNTTMEHLLCCIDVTQLGQLPFVPAHNSGLVVSARELGLPIHPQGAAYVFPVIGGFVGGDTVAGILATKLASIEGPVMMVDIGTNGEIVLAHNGKLFAASTAAGPAFEGARISCGMRATRGAIEKVSFDLAGGGVHCSVIGDAPAIGICGSGLIDLAAELLTAGVVTPEGRMLPPDELPPAIPGGLKDRVTRDADGQVQFLVDRGDRHDSTPIIITQRDIRQLQLASGAIRAGIAILLRQCGLVSTDLKRIFIAGGFGSFIRRSHAQRIGLMPSDMEHSKIVYVGNASLNGARWALLSTEIRKRGETLAAKTAHVELSQDPQFQMEFADAMIFPVKG